MVLLDKLQVDPDKTALMVVDVQNDFCLREPGFAYFDRQEKAGREDLKPIEDTIDRYLIPFIARSRESDLYIVYLQSAYEQGQFPDMPNLCIEGTRGWELFKVGPNPRNPREKVLIKDAHDPFTGENSLENFLHGDGLDILIISGVTTDNCVSAATYVSLGRGYKPVVLADCVSTAGYKSETAHKQKLQEFASHGSIILTNSENISFKPK